MNRHQHRGAPQSGLFAYLAYTVGVGLLVALLSLLAGCARPVLQASKADMSRSRHDHYQCVQESSLYYGGSGLGLLAARADADRESNRLYRMCMEARGYTVTER